MRRGCGRQRATGGDGLAPGGQRGLCWAQLAQHGAQVGPAHGEVGLECVGVARRQRAVEVDRLARGGQRRLVAGHCTGRDVLDVVANHEFTVVHHENSWRVVESSAVKLARQDLIRVQQAAEELRSADRRKDQFIAMLGHELRNPLAPIASAVGLMRLRTPAHDTRELDIIERQVRQLTTLVDDLLDLSRITRGLMELHTTPVPVRDALTVSIESSRAGTTVRVGLPLATNRHALPESAPQTVVRAIEARPPRGN